MNSSVNYNSDDDDFCEKRATCKTLNKFSYAVNIVRIVLLTVVQVRCFKLLRCENDTFDMSFVSCAFISESECLSSCNPQWSGIRSDRMDSLTHWHGPRGKSVTCVPNQPRTSPKLSPSFPEGSMLVEGYIHLVSALSKAECTIIRYFHHSHPARGSVAKKNQNAS